MVSFLEQQGFTVIRIRGSHHFLGRDEQRTSVPVHGNCVFRSIAATDSEMNPAAYSDVNPATYSDVIPATFWRVPGSNRNSKLNIQQSGAGH
jgi:HicA toxin of bacterial toxin-antitoxin,